MGSSYYHILNHFMPGVRYRFHLDGKVSGSETVDTSVAAKDKWCGHIVPGAGVNISVKGFGEQRGHPVSSSLTDSQIW